MKKGFKKFLACLVFLSAVTFFVKKIFGKKQTQSNCNTDFNDSKVIGMRVVENPFEAEVTPNQETHNEVVVTNQDFNGYQVYKRDIWTIVGTVVVIVAVIIISSFAYESKVTKDEASRIESVKVETELFHSLGEIESAIGVVSMKIDSLDMHVKDGTKAMNEMMTNLKNANNKKGKKQ